MSHISIPRDHEKSLINSLHSDASPSAQRLCRLYDMPDLSRTPGNPVQLIVDKVRNMPLFRNFDTIETPEIVGLYETFDLFNFAPDHPARSPSDTYFISSPSPGGEGLGGGKILRTHTTVMWYYYLTHPGIKEKLEQTGECKVLSWGKVYRRDEIDRKHHCVFHQIDGLYIVEKKKKILTTDDLAEVLVAIGKEIYGPTAELRVFPDTFPYTEPSLQMETYMNSKDIELFGSGIVHDRVLENLGIDSTRYNGRAFGPGIERLVMPQMQIPDIRLFRSTDPRVTSQWGNLDKTFIPVSKFPSTSRDISFIVKKTVPLNDYYDLVRDLGGDLVEGVELLDTYTNDEKIGPDAVSRTFRISYRSHERTLTTEEINAIQATIRQETAGQLGAVVR